MMKRISALAAACMLAAGGAQAATVNYMASLNGASEVPPNPEKGTGEMTGTLDTATKVFNYTVNYKDLTGPATAAHFHVAPPGANGPVTVPINPPTSGVKGQATLTDEQIANMDGGKVYVNVHTAAHGPGEIRGQVMKH